MGSGKGSSVSLSQSLARSSTKSSVKVAWLSRMKVVSADFVLAKKDSCLGIEEKI